MQHGSVGLGPRVRLHIDPLGPKNSFGALNGQVFGLVYLLAAAVVASARVAFRVFVG